MSVFRRRGRDRDDGQVPDAEPADDGVPADVADREQAGRGTGSRDLGPWDISEVADPEARGLVDLGGLWLPGVDGLEIRVETDQATGAIIAVTLVLEESGLQLQPFAAPRTEGIWDEVRTEIAAGITQQGGTADLLDGPFGGEVRAKVPVQLPDGSSGAEPARFVGVDGPRWFLRGVLTGRAAVEPGADETLIGLFRQVVVVRGALPMAPREAIPLRLPEAAVGVEGIEPGEGIEHGEDAEDERAEDLQPFERGPEITEIH